MQDKYHLQYTQIYQNIHIGYSYAIAFSLVIKVILTPKRKIE